MSKILQSNFVGELALLSSGYLIYHEEILPRVRLPQGVVNIGTNPPNSPLYIKNDSKSKDLPLIDEQHCSIFFDPYAECFAIKDSFSQHGTWLNGHLLDPQHSIHLVDGDEIQLGNALLDGGALLRFFFFLLYDEAETEAINQHLNLAD